MIERTQQGEVAILTLAHGKANTLDVEFCEAIAAAFKEIEASSARAVVMTGQGRIFSAGVDLMRLTAGGAATGTGIGPRAIHAALGVVKAYTTRVGAGPLPTEFDEVMGEQVRTLGNEFGATTGRPRRCGWFDAVVVRYAVRVNGLSALAVTKLDVLDTLGRIGLCTGDSVGNETLEEFPGDLADLEGVQPRYEWFEGWRTSTEGARKLADLPKTARAYLDRIEALVDCPIRYVSVGTRRDQILEVA